MMKKAYLLFTAMTSALTVPSFADDLTGTNPTINTEVPKTDEVKSEAMIETKDHYTLEKKQVDHDRGHGKLEKESNPTAEDTAKTSLSEAKNSEIMTNQVIDPVTVSPEITETLQNVNLSFEGDISAPQPDQINQQVKADEVTVENNKLEHGSEVSKPTDTSLAAGYQTLTTKLNQLAENLAHIDQDKKFNGADMISRCKMVSESLNELGKLVDDVTKLETVHNSYKDKTKAIDTYCADVQRRINEIQSAPLDNIDGLTSSIVIDGSYEIKNKIEDIIQFLQQQSSKNS